MEHQNNNPSKRHNEGKENQAKKLFNILKKPMSRRMAATYLGFEDQTFMVTQDIFDWLESGKAQIIGYIKCERSGHIVQAITTNTELFIKESTNQLKLL